MRLAMVFAFNHFTACPGSIRLCSGCLPSVHRPVCILGEQVQIQQHPSRHGLNDPLELFYGKQAQLDDSAVPRVSLVFLSELWNGSLRERLRRRLTATHTE
jgi:hypothetical protein